MTLTLHSHPFSSYCQKVLVALHELGAPFETVLVNFGDEASRSAFLALWPVGKMPVLVDSERGVTLPESSIIIEHLDTHHRGSGTSLLPGPAETTLEVRLWDRIFDNHVQTPLQRIVFDRLRPADDRDPTGVAQAHAQLRTAYDLIEQRMSGRDWAVGDSFTLADCSAAPALFYAELVEPFGEWPNLKAYLARLNARPSFARVVADAAPMMPMFPKP
jgi:glutathione S-transferase